MEYVSLSILFDRTHFHEFGNLSAEEKKGEEARILMMIEQSGLDVTYRITYDGIEFAFTDEEHANKFQLNMLAMYGDSDAGEHGVEFPTAEDRDRWIDCANEVAAGLGIVGCYDVDDLSVHLSFASLEDATIFREAMEAAIDDGPEEAIVYGRILRTQLAQLRQEVHGVGLG